MKNTDGDEFDVIELIAELRGGIPEKCDFCDQENPPEHMTPEEAGMWACLDCWDRWEKEEGERSDG